MKYRLITNEYMETSLETRERIAVNRGIELDKIEHYFNTTDDDIHSPRLFGPAIVEGAKMLIKAVSCGARMGVLVDDDADGYTAGALFINMMYDLFPFYTINNLDWVMHKHKAHGLNDTVEEMMGFDVIVLPDSSSNDYEHHKALRGAGKVIIILDHHEAEKVSEDAIVINNQLSDYPNKHLSGVGVVWQFFRYVESLLGSTYHKDYYDLVATGLIADMVSTLDFEIRHLIGKGIRPRNLMNPLIAGLVKKHDYSITKKSSPMIDNVPTPMGFAFFVSPFLNALVRSGTTEEKSLIFNAMIKFKANQMILSTKRGHKLGEMETVLTQALRVATNVKKRQTEAEQEGIALVNSIVKENDLLKNKVITIFLEPGQINKNIAGLVCNKTRPVFKRPVVILTRRINEETGEETFEGSARGYKEGGVEKFKDICNSIDCVKYAHGHQGAFGLGIGAKDKENLVAQFNEKLQDFEPEDVYKVDYEFLGDDIDTLTIAEISAMTGYWGQDFDEPFVAIKSLKVTANMVRIFRKNTNTLKITTQSGVSLIKFNASEEECELFQENNTGFVEVDIVGKASVNEWQEEFYPQIMIEDYTIIDKNKYYF